MFETGQVLRCREGLSLPPDSFCVDTEATSLADTSFLVAHLPDGDGLVLQAPVLFVEGFDHPVGGVMIADWGIRASRLDQLRTDW